MDSTSAHSNNEPSCAPHTAENKYIVGKFVLEFIASEVLAKHDENYMPPEVADALEKAGQMKSGTAPVGAAK